MSAKDMINTLKFKKLPHELQKCIVIFATVLACQSMSGQTVRGEFHMSNSGSLTYRSYQANNNQSGENTDARTVRLGAQSNQSRQYAQETGRRRSAGRITGAVYRIYNDGQSDNSAIIQCDGGGYLLIENPGNGIKWMNNARVKIDLEAGNSMVVTQSRVADRYDTPHSYGHKVYDRVKNIYNRSRQIYDNPDRVFRDAEDIERSIDASRPAVNRICADAFMGHRENGHFVKDYQVNDNQNMHRYQNDGMVR